MMPCLTWARECSECLQPSGPVSLHPTVGWMALPTVPGVREPVHEQEPALGSAVNEQSQEEDESDVSDTASTEGLLDGLSAEQGPRWYRGDIIVD